jgi:DNA-directed RNA polymerase specialized sigma24 family protein
MSEEHLRFLAVQLGLPENSPVDQVMDRLVETILPSVKYHGFGLTQYEEEEAVQNVVVTLLKELKKQDTESSKICSIPGWLFRAAQNIVLDLCRGRKRRGVELRWEPPAIHDSASVSFPPPVLPLDDCRMAWNIASTEEQWLENFVEWLALRRAVAVAGRREDPNDARWPRLLACYSEWEVSLQGNRSHLIVEVFCRVYDLSPRQVAEASGLTDGNVRQILHRFDLAVRRRYSEL